MSYPMPKDRTREAVAALRASASRWEEGGDADAGEALRRVADELEAKLAHTLVDCPRCGGSGVRRHFRLERPCIRCGGEGRVVA